MRGLWCSKRAGSPVMRFLFEDTADTASFLLFTQALMFALVFYFPSQLW